MKQQIYLLCQLLMLRNAKVTTLEVKNSAHGLFASDPSFSLTQKETSSLMAELYVENGWHRELNTTSIPGIQFYEYSLQPIAAPQATQPATQPLASATNTGTGMQLDPLQGSHVCYVSGDPEKYVQGNKDKSALKKECFQAYNDSTFGLTYNNLNYCTVDYYNKHKAQA